MRIISMLLCLALPVISYSEPILIATKAGEWSSWTTSTRETYADLSHYNQNQVYLHWINDLQIHNLQLHESSELIDLAPAHIPDNVPLPITSFAPNQYDGSTCFFFIGSDGRLYGAPAGNPLEGSWTGLLTHNSLDPYEPPICVGTVDSGTTESSLLIDISGDALDTLAVTNAPTSCGLLKNMLFWSLLDNSGLVSMFKPAPEWNTPTFFTEPETTFIEAYHPSMLTPTYYNSIYFIEPQDEGNYDLISRFEYQENVDYYDEWSSSDGYNARMLTSSASPSFSVAWVDENIEAIDHIRYFNYFDSPHTLPREGKVNKLQLQKAYCESIRTPEDWEIQITEWVVWSEIGIDDSTRLFAWPAHTISQFVSAKEPALKPYNFNIDAIYPNPFNSNVRVDITLTKSAKVRISVFNQLGREIALLADGFRESGHLNLSWTPESISSGQYFLRISIDDKITTSKLIYLK